MIDSFEDNTENPADPQEEQIPKTSTSVAKSKAKTKPQPRELVGTTTTILIHQRNRVTLNHQNKILNRTIFRRKSHQSSSTVRSYIEN